VFPTDLFECPKDPEGLFNSKPNLNEDDYEFIVKQTFKLYDEMTNNGENTVESARFTGCIIRTAGHDFMDYRTNMMGNEMGGSDGCMNFNDPDNDGIVPCLLEFGFLQLYRDCCHLVSLADFLVITAEAAMIRGHDDFDNNPEAIFN